MKLSLFVILSRNRRVLRLFGLIVGLRFRIDRLVNGFVSLLIASFAPWARPTNRLIGGSFGFTHDNLLF